MALRHRPFTEADAKEVADWQYGPPYDIYNFGGWEKALAGGSGLTRPEIRAQEFYALEEDGLFAGFFRFMELDPGDHGMLSLGLRPALCGRGRGKELMALAKEEWAARCSHLPLRLEVRTFNQRARKQYEAAGFHAVRQYERPTPAGAAEFLLMEWVT